MIIEDLCEFPTNNTYLISKIIHPSFTRLKLVIINLKDTYEEQTNFTTVEREITILPSWRLNRF